MNASTYVGLFHNFLFRLLKSFVLGARSLLGMNTCCRGEQETEGCLDGQAAASAFGSLALSCYKQFVNLAGTRMVRIDPLGRRGELCGKLSDCLLSTAA